MHQIHVTSGQSTHARHTSHTVRKRVLVRHGRRVISVRRVRHAGHMIQCVVGADMWRVATAAGDGAIRRHAAVVVGRRRQTRAAQRRIYLADLAWLLCCKGVKSQFVSQFLCVLNLSPIVLLLLPLLLQ